MKNRIKELREDKDMKQSDLAQATGIDQRTISNYETGKTNPDAFALIQLADFFEVSIDYLLYRTDYDFFNSEKQKKHIDVIINALENLKKSI